MGASSKIEWHDLSSFKMYIVLTHSFIHSFVRSFIHRLIHRSGLANAVLFQREKKMVKHSTNQPAIAAKLEV